MEVRPKRIEKYLTENGRCPYDEWFESQRDKRTQAIIAVRLNRVMQGNFGLCRRLEDGVWELKIEHGPKFRVYFAEDGDVIVVLLCGGDKATQVQDIQRAREFWADYRKE
jgi:putative addiction module killer protein